MFPEVYSVIIGENSNVVFLYVSLLINVLFCVLFNEVEIFLLTLSDSKLFSKVDSILLSTFIVCILFTFTCSNEQLDEIFSLAEINPIEQNNIKII